MMQGNPALGVVASLLSDDPYESLMEGVRAGRHAGVETVNGTECDRLKFQQAGLDWDIWVATGDQPKVVRIVPDMGKALSEIADAEEMPDQLKQLQDMKMEFVVDFTGWAFNPELPADRFAFTPPEGAELAESLFEGLDVGGEEHPLLGRPAPDLTLDLHGGGRLDLAALKDKKVVVLDFWASWCGPCVKGMPIVAGVAEDFKDRDVVLYAVNLREDKETIEGFLKEHQLTLNVALDPDGSSGDAYAVEGIPQTVLIGRDGRVEAVHVGLLPDLKKKLTSELESLVKGEKLVAE
jgi:thiol-disulfide isomerase/thioredoxin